MTSSCRRPGVILFSEDKASWRLNSIWTKRSSFDQKGHFRITGLMPGRYYVAAVPRQRLDPSRAGDADAAFFEQLAKEATLVVVGADEQRESRPPDAGCLRRAGSQQNR